MLLTFSHMLTSYEVHVTRTVTVYIKISCRSDIKESMTAGSIIVFSNGDRKMAANEEAIFSLLRRVHRAMTGEMTPGSNIEEELSRVFFFCFPVLVQSSLLCAIHE